MSVIASSPPSAAGFLVYINGIEVPAKSVTLRHGVWQIPEMRIEMVADPVIARLGAEDRVQVVVFYLDDVAPSPEVAPQFRVFGEGEITGWGYRNTSAGRSIVFTVICQIAVFTQLFVQFLTALDDMIGHATGPADVTGFANPTDQLVYPFSLFVQGVIPGKGQDASTITRPFDFLYNVVRNMIGAQIPETHRTIPAANFFARWARLTNCHNRFAASPFFDEIVDNDNVFPVLRAVQDVSAVDVIARNLMPNIQNAGSLWDMIQLVFSTMLMEIAMIPAMPLVTVDLASGLVQQTDFSEHGLIQADDAWVPALRADSRKARPKRIPNFFAKPQMLFSIPPACNALFPSQVKTLAFDENYAPQPTRLYFNDETMTRILKIPASGLAETIHNALSTGFPFEADLGNKLHDKFPRFNGKNFLLWPEEYFKGPVMDRRDVPPWLYFLGQSQFSRAAGSPRTSDGATSAPPVPASPAPAPRPSPGPSVMRTSGRVGQLSANGQRVYSPRVEALRPRATRAQAATGIPVDLLLAWVSHESDGKLDAVSPLNERGYFQIMGPHVVNGTAKTLKDVEAGILLGLGLEDTGKDAVDPAARLSRDADFSFQQGVRLVQAYMRMANQAVARAGLAWPDGDVWRLAKLCHGLPSLAIGGPGITSIIARAQATLGHPPTSWEEMHKTTLATLSPLEAKVVEAATAVGGVVAGASGQMTTQGDPGVVAAPPAQPAPVTGSPATTRVDPPAALPPPTVTPADHDDIQRNSLTVYQLYAKYEYFRERYAKRSGSATIAWNPYVVAGFPAMVFDQRASRIDLACYLTTIQQAMSNDGTRSTTVSFLYGRQLQEMFDLMRQEFADGETAAGSAPAEPVRDVRKIVQSFDQAEAYYQRLFHGGQRLHGKDAAFDFRKVVGYASQVDGGAPEPIFIDGPDEATQDALVAATALAQRLVGERDTASAQRAQLAGRIATAYEDLSALTDVADAISAAAAQTKSAEVIVMTKQRDALDAQLASIDQRLAGALSTIQGSRNESGLSRVRHNLVGDRELVPLPPAQPLFDSYAAAMRFAWRPICTLDEYIVFYDAAGEGAIPAFGHPRSVGARYFDRIRRLVPPVEGFVPPRSVLEPPVSGGQPSVDGLSPPAFPQTRSDWDRALLAYRQNALSVKAPRT